MFCFFFFSKLDALYQLGLHPRKQFHLINVLMFSLCLLQRAMISFRVCHRQRITELLQVLLLVWEAKQVVETDKAVEMASAVKLFLRRGC